MRRALGKGLSQLIAEQFEGGLTEVSPDNIIANPRQPRSHFDEEALAELAESIRQFGILQPLLVRPNKEGTYELIAGERRLRAAKLAGLKSVPIVIRSADNQNSLEIALIENVQREDINSLECARAYRKLMDEFGLTQEEVAVKVGKSRTAVANVVRLLKLPSRILEALEKNDLTEGHARALLGFENPAMQIAVFEKVLAEGLTVRDVEQLAKRGGIVDPRLPRPAQAHDPHQQELVSALQIYFGAPVKIERKGKKGAITLEFYDDEDLQRILEVLGLQL